MNEDYKTVWIDTENNGKVIQKTESLFWDFPFGLMNAGYRIM